MCKIPKEMWEIMNRPLTSGHIPAPKLYSEVRVRYGLSNKHSIHVRISRPWLFSHLSFMFKSFFFNRFRNPPSISSPNSFHLYRVHLLLLFIIRLKKKRFHPRLGLFITVLFSSFSTRRLSPPPTFKRFHLSDTSEWSIFLLIFL